MMSKKRSNSLIRKGAQNDGINQPNLIKAASNTLNAQQNVKSAKKYKPYPKNDIIQHPINRKIWMGDRKTIQNENRLNFISYGRCDINGIRQNGHIYYLCEAERPGEHCDFERRDVQEIDVHQASGHKWRQVDSILQFTFNPNGSDQEESSNDDQENEDIVEVQYTKAQEILLSWLAIHGIAFLAIEDPLFDQYNEEIVKQARDKKNDSNASKTTTQIGLNLLTSVLQKLFGTETTLAIDTGTKSGNTYAALTPNNPTIQPNCVILHIVEGIATGEQVGQLIANTINELKPYHIKLISLISDSARSLLSALRWDETNINSFIHFLEEFPEEGILHLKCLCHLLQRALVKSTEQNQDLMDYTSNLIAFSKLLQKKIYKIQFKQRCPKHQPQRWMYLVMLTLFVEVNQDQIRTVFPTTIPYLNISTEQFIYESLQLHRILHPTYILILRFEASYTSLSDVAPLLIQYFQRLSRITQLHKEQSWIEIVNCIANNVYALTFDNIDGPLYHLAYALTPMGISSLQRGALYEAFLDIEYQIQAQFPNLMFHQQPENQEEIQNEDNEDFKLNEDEKQIEQQDTDLKQEAFEEMQQQILISNQLQEIEISEIALRVAERRRNISEDQVITEKQMEKDIDCETKNNADIDSESNNNKKVQQEKQKNTIQNKAKEILKTIRQNNLRDTLNVTLSHYLKRIFYKEDESQLRKAYNLCQRLWNMGKDKDFIGKNELCNGGISFWNELELSGNNIWDLEKERKNKRKMNEYELLCHFARIILQIPTSEASCERVFSLIRRIVGDNRCSLKIGPLEGILRICNLRFSNSQINELEMHQIEHKFRQQTDKMVVPFSHSSIIQLQQQQQQQQMIQQLQPNDQSELDHSTQLQNNISLSSSSSSLLQSVDQHVSDLQQNILNPLDILPIQSTSEQSISQLSIQQKQLYLTSNPNSTQQQQSISISRNEATSFVSNQDSEQSMKQKQIELLTPKISSKRSINANMKKKNQIQQLVKDIEEQQEPNNMISKEQNEISEKLKNKININMQMNKRKRRRTDDDDEEYQYSDNNEDLNKI